MPEITHLAPNVDLISHGGRKFFIIGTAHVSLASAQLVEQTIASERPDTVCVELCLPRLESLSDPHRWRNTNIFEVIRSGRAYLLLAQLVLASFQKRVGDRLGIKPGEEMLRAIQSAKAANARLVPIDREIKITLKRAWGNAGLWSVCKIVFSLIASLFSREEISESAIEELKSGDALIAVMNEFNDVLPDVKTALIDERDSYMAEKILDAPGNTVVAVVGAGHVPGILSKFGTPVNLSELETIPAPSTWGKIFVWGLPSLFFLILAYGFATAGVEAGTQMIGVWVLATGGLAALGALIALAHPLTVLAAFIGAPFTCLHPAIAVGWICGLTEALLRKPQVGDLENIADDLSTVRGFWSNRVSKILLVMAFANIGGSIGTFVGLGKLASLL